MAFARTLIAVAAIVGWGCGSPTTKATPDLAMVTSQLPASDTFAGSALDPSWSVLHPEAVTLTVAGGALTATLTRAALWYNGSEGVLVYKLVTGDFKLTSTVHARKASSPSQPPSPPEELGGVSVRAPAAPPENYVHIVVGSDTTALATETKTTVNSSSHYSFLSQATGDAELRVCRVGAAFQMLQRAPGATTWTLATTFMRPDLPSTLQAGLNLYSAASPFDLQVTYDEATFAAVATAADCSAD